MVYILQRAYEPPMVKGAVQPIKKKKKKKKKKPARVSAFTSAKPCSQATCSGMAPRTVGASTDAPIIDDSQQWLDSVAEEAGEANSLLAGSRLHEPKDERNKLYIITSIIMITHISSVRLTSSFFFFFFFL
jgi:hypothetical protein